MGTDQRVTVRVDPLEFEQECETWDWARTAGVSARELQEAVREALRAAEAPSHALAEAA